MNDQVNTDVAQDKANTSNTLPEFLKRLPEGTKVSPAPQADLGVTETEVK